MPHLVHESTPRTARNLKPTSAAFKGLDGVFKQLVTEHREAATLLKQFRALDEGDTKTRRDVWFELSTALLSHERAELQAVYTALEGYPTLQDIVDDHAHQAHRLEALLSELDALPLTSPAWRVTFQRLEATVKQHVSEEESEFFPRARGAIGKDKSEELEIRYRTVKRALLRGM